MVVEAYRWKSAPILERGVAARKRREMGVVRRDANVRRELKADCATLRAPEVEGAALAMDVPGTDLAARADAEMRASEREVMAA